MDYGAKHGHGLSKPLLARLKMRSEPTHHLRNPALPNPLQTGLGDMDLLSVVQQARIMICVSK